MNTISFGSRGDDVKLLQRKLYVTADGIFGKITREAVKAFQLVNGLTVDGVAGPKTWSRLGFETAETVEAQRPINMIIVHCSATPRDKSFSKESLEAAHAARKFSTYTADGKTWHIGYHYYVRRDGTIEACRPENVRGCHVSGHNAGTIGVCYEGGCDVSTNPKWAGTAIDTRTGAQKAALLRLLKELKGRYPGATIHGHREFANKGCPCFDAAAEYNGL